MQLPVFLEELARELAASRSGAFALLLVQIRNLSDINVSLGYDVADAALAQLASILAEAFGGKARVASIGVRRFAVVLQDLRTEAHALLAAKKIERLAQEPLNAAGHRVKLEVAQGLASAPGHASSAPELLRCAEKALDSARSTGDSLVVFDPSREIALEELHRIDTVLGRALEQGGIEPYFQPQIDLCSGRPSGAEALLRCRDGSGQFLKPELAIAAAERTKRLRDVTSAMLNAALRYAQEWPVAGCSLSVNVGTRSLNDPDLAPLIADALSIWGRRPDLLTIEITESSFMTEPETSFRTLRALRDLGVCVAIDDFGTGFSSLAYFRDIPATELKVDKSFVLNMLDSAADRRIVQAVINLAHSFGLAVVAEGVEDEETYNLLRKLGCDGAQGYWIGRPMAAAHFTAWLGASTA
jgi:diguanylate cyclase (GGDEF)-like protein